MEKSVVSGMEKSVGSGMKKSVGSGMKKSVGSGMEKSVGSGINIPGPQQWSCGKTVEFTLRYGCLILRGGLTSRIRNNGLVVKLWNLRYFTVRVPNFYYGTLRVKQFDVEYPHPL
jgi:hypothetical protein